jgi:hypothetical protein
LLPLGQKPKVGPNYDTNCVYFINFEALRQLWPAGIGLTFFAPHTQ